MESLEEEWSSRQYNFLNPKEGGLYRVWALMARTSSNLTGLYTISFVYLYSVLVILPRLVIIHFKCLVPIYVFPKIKLLLPKQNYNVLSPSFYTHIYVWEIYIFPGSVCLFCCRKYVDQSWENINRSQTQECRNWDWGRAIPKKGIHECDFLWNVRSRTPPLL